MKAIPSIAFNEFHGTASEVTARQIGGRTILNGRAQHSHVKSARQSQRRADFSYITKQFRQLTEEQLAGWTELARTHRRQAAMGGEEQLTAQNLFVGLNTNRAILGKGLVMEAPAELHGSTYIKFDDLWITPARLVITGLGAPDTRPSRLVIRMASTDSLGRAKLWGQTVIVDSFEEPSDGKIDFTEVYTSQFGVHVQLGRKYFFEFYWIDENSGYVSQVTRVSFESSESRSINGREYPG